MPPRRSWINLGAVLTLTLGAGAPTATAEPAPKQEAVGQLKVRITGLNSNKGNVAVALFNSAADFPKQERAFLGEVTQITKKAASVTFRNLRPGLYAIAVLHDENQNAKMDFNFLGMPLEGYGFSNDASAMFGPPDFADAAFKLKPRPSAVSIKIRYFSL